MPTFTKAITNTLKVGFLVGILSALIGLLLHTSRSMCA